MVTDTDAMMRALYGQHAIQIPINIITQPCQEGGRVIGIFQTSAGLPMLFGSKKTHQIIFGDCVIRPHAVLHSDEFAGMGLSGMMRDAWTEVEKWSKGGILLNPTGELPR